MCTYQDAASYVLLNDVSKDSDGKSEKMAGDKYQCTQEHSVTTAWKDGLS